MDAFLTALAGLTLVASLVLAARLAAGLRAMPSLDDEPPAGLDPVPTVSVVVAARNEARDIAAAVCSFLAQDYPALDVVAVNDRSTDGTGAILDRLAATQEGLSVIHVDELPDGWLGKNHALHRGAAAATGELILFTDADVIMSPDTVTRAVSMLEREGADHLAVAPRLRTGSAWATLTVAVFLVVFLSTWAPWKARDPRSRAHIGVGAFNLVRAAVYRAIDGHRGIRLRPDDDVRLGRQIKEAGFTQLAAGGQRSVEVEWYPSLRAMARGLEKNSFAVVDYRLGVVLLAGLLPLVFDFWPVLALLVTAGAAWWLNAAIVALGVLSTADTARRNGLPAWTGLTYPIGAVLLLWIVWRAALRVTVRGRVEWRGTSYALETLREASSSRAAGS